MAKKHNRKPLMVSILCSLFLAIFPSNFMNTKLPLLAILTPLVPFLLYIESKKLKKEFVYWGCLGLVAFYLILIKVYYIIF